MHQTNRLNSFPQHFEWLEADPLKFQQRDRTMMQVVGGLIESIRKSSSNLLFHILFAMQNHRPFQAITKHAQIIESEQMVRMAMGIQDRLNEIDFFTQ